MALKFKIERTDEPKEVDKLTIEIGNGKRFVLEEVQGDLQIRKVYDDDGAITIRPSVSNVIYIK